MTEFMHDDEVELICRQPVGHEGHIFLVEDRRGPGQRGCDHVRPKMQYGGDDAFPSPAETLRPSHISSAEVVEQVSIEVLENRLERVVHANQRPVLKREGGCIEL